MSSRKTKVLYIIETLGIGGAEGLLVSVLANIDKEKFHATVVCISGRDDLKEDLGKIGITVHCLKLRSLYSCWSAILKLCRIMKKERFDIVHTHLFFANIYGRLAARMCGVKIIISTLHNPDYSYENNGTWSFKIRELVDKYTGKMFNTAFIAVSDFVRKDFEKHLGFKNIKVIHNSIDAYRFTKLDSFTIDSKRAELNLGKEDIVILNIGRLHPQKGQVSLIEALSLLCKNNPKYKLIIIGKGALEIKLKSRIDKLGLRGSVIFLKDRRDIIEMMSVCDIFAFPSVYEGFGIALLEAMSCAMPVVASDIAALREILRDGIDGILVPAGNLNALAEAISGLAQDKTRRALLSENARKRVLELFDINAHVKNIEDTYQELFSNAG